MSDIDDGHRASAIRKLNWRLMPFLMACFLVAYLDRSNISVAALTMNADLGLTTAMYGLAAGLFFVTIRCSRSPATSPWRGSARGAGSPALW